MKVYDSSYTNYKVESWENIDLEKVEELFVTGKLELLSEIQTEDILVKILSDKE